MMGMRPVAEMQFIDFISCAFDMITNFAAKSRYRTGVGVPLVIRGPSGGGVHGGPFHSQNPEAYFAHTPGLKIVQPATAYDAKGLIKAAIRDDDPVLFFEHKFLYRRDQGGAARRATTSSRSARPRCAAPGRDLSIITYGAMVWTALEAAKTLEAEGIDAEVVDLRTLFPLDEETVLESVGEDEQGDPPPRGHAHRRDRRRDRRGALRALLRVPGRPARARHGARHAGAVLAAARGVLPAERRKGLPGGAGPRGVLRMRRRRRSARLIPFGRPQGPPSTTSVSDKLAPCTSKAPSPSRRPAEKVWDYLTDPEKVSEPRPGLEKLEIVEPGKKFRATTSIGFGSVKVRFVNDVEWVELDPPNRARDEGARHRAGLAAWTRRRR